MDNIGLFPGEEGPRVYTVSALTEEVKDLLEEHFDFIWVEGEISNFRIPSSGHYYMVLKDEKAQIKAVMFRPQSRYLKFTPEDGMKVITQGRIGIYEPRGEYQIILDYLEPLGVGALALAFEQLKRRLEAEGLFDEGIKRPLPFLPQRVAVITSPTGAAVRDFLKIIHRRFANIEITVVPVKVQGEKAAAEIVEALETVNRELDVDVIVLTRGGGSLEDLWPFNQEELAYAIRASRIPVVSAVGHEIDMTISDLVADLRAPTPSGAAELLVVEKESLGETLNELKNRLEMILKASLTALDRQLVFLTRGLRDPRRRLADFWMRLDDMNGRMIRLAALMIKERRQWLASEVRALRTHSPLNRLISLAEKIDYQRRSLALFMGRRHRDYQMRLSLLMEKLRDLSPLSVLERGYSIAWKLPEELILKGVEGLESGDHVRVLLAEGEMTCRVEEVTEGRKKIGTRVNTGMSEAN